MHNCGFSSVWCSKSESNLAVSVSCIPWKSENTVQSVNLGNIVYTGYCDVEHMLEIDQVSNKGNAVKQKRNTML